MTTAHHPTPDRTRRQLTIPDAINMLSRTPATLQTWLRDLPEEWLHGNEGGESWSAIDVVGHLIHGERTDWLPRVKRVLEHGDAVAFEKFDRFAQFNEFAGLTMPHLLDEFARVRESNLHELESLKLHAEDLARLGLHPALGPVTLRNLLATWVTHDLDHVMQIARVLARQYTDEVGPWSAYLRVISGKQG